MHLFLVMLGGRVTGCNIELHDVRWVVGETIKDTIPELKKQWIGSRRGLHIDSYRRVKQVDGYQVSIHTGSERHAGQPKGPKLWFVNLGAYSASDMAEQHQFGLITAESTQAAKAKTKRMWLRGLEQIHKDDLFPVDGSPNVDDLLPIDGNGLWHVRLTPSSNETNDSDTPEWYGYWRI